MKLSKEQLEKYQKIKKYGMQKKLLEITEMKHQPHLSSYLNGYGHINKERHEIIINFINSFKTD